MSTEDRNPRTTDLDRWPAARVVEAVTGSTRLKAGTATKVLRNAFSTALMVRSGRSAVLTTAGGDVPLALVHALSGRPLDECRAALSGRGVRAALDALC